MNTKRTILVASALGILAIVLSPGDNVRAHFRLGKAQNLGISYPSDYGRFDYGAWGVSVTADGLELYFSKHTDGLGGFDIWVSARQSVNDPWGPPILLDASFCDAGSVSPDGRSWYLLGATDIFCVPIAPVLDFDGDGVVGMGDLVQLIQSWGKADPAVDMGPQPWGDGNVDEKDLEVLMGCWGQEVYDPSLLAHWKLDETSGTVAADSAGTNDGRRPAGVFCQHH